MMHHFFFNWVVTMTDSRLDPLIFGTFEHRRPVGLFAASTNPPPTLKHTARLPRTRTDRPEMDERDKAEEDELSEILACVQEEHMRRKQQLQQAAPEQVELKLASTWTDDDVEAIAMRARVASMPCMCLVGPRHLDEDMIMEWNAFCRKTCAYQRLFHQDAPTSLLAGTVGILCFNSKGQCMVVDEQWTLWLLYSGNVRQLFVLSMLDTTHTIETLEDLEDNMSALAYDCECVRAQDVMMKWRCDATHCVIPLNRTPMQFSCVVTRRNQMYEIVKL